MDTFHDVKVVILGQDPYHNPRQAVGASFAVAPGVALPPSLQNIYKELQSDLGYPPVHHGYLRGVGGPRRSIVECRFDGTSRRSLFPSESWLGRVDRCCHCCLVCTRRRCVHPVGERGQKKAAVIDTSKNAIIASAHRSPLSASRGFFGSRPFSRTNAALGKMGEAPINWQLPETVKAD